MRRKLAAVGGSYLIGLIFASIFFDFAIFLICGVILLIAVAIITAILTRKYDISVALLCRRNNRIQLCILVYGKSG